jgi:hypothetical protein
MTLTIGGYKPVNVAKAFNILRAQYIISTDDIGLFLKSKAMAKGFMEFEKEKFVFEALNLDIKRDSADKTTITITYHKLDGDYILKLMKEARKWNQLNS